jgi:hypothetical protein
MTEPTTDMTWTIPATDRPVDRFRATFGREPTEADIKRHERARLLLMLGMARSKARIAHVVAGR